MSLSKEVGMLTDKLSVLANGLWDESAEVDAGLVRSAVATLARFDTDLRILKDRIVRMEQDRNERDALPDVPASRLEYLDRRLADLAERVAALEPGPRITYRPIVQREPIRWEPRNVEDVKIGDSVLDDRGEFVRVAQITTTFDPPLVTLYRMSGTDGAGNDTYERAAEPYPFGYQVGVYELD